MEHLEDILTLDEEQRAVQEAAHQFAEEVIRPAGIELDRLPPSGCISVGI